MTREEAIKMLKYNSNVIHRTINGETDPREVEALDMAIEALEQESSYNSINSLVESNLKNPKAKTFDVLHFVADNAWLSTFEAIEKAYNFGVSEQEQVLDKIRAEILEDCGYSKDYVGAFTYSTIKVATVLQILDKYKAESEASDE